MKEVIFDKLKLTNFRGQNLEIDFQDKTHIVGPNGSGKTTVFNGILWLFIGTDDLDRTNYDLYDNTKEFTSENAIPVEDELWLRVDGQPMKLKKTAKQKWVRKRGQVEYVKDKSDEYKYYIDDLEVSANSYKQQIEAIFAPTDKLPLMLNIRHFLTLEWRKLRKHFADIVGEVQESELVGDYTSISELLKRGSEKAKEYVRQQLLPLKNQQTDIKADIKANQRSLPDLSDVDEAMAQLESKKARIAEIDAEIEGVGIANKPFVDKRNAELKQIDEMKAALSRASASWDADQRAEVKKAEQAYEAAKREAKAVEDYNHSLNAHAESFDAQIKSLDTDIAETTEQRDKLREVNEEIKGREFTSAPECPHCHQPLPVEMIPAARKAFYDANDAERAVIVERGKALNDKIAKKEAMRDELIAKKSELVIKDVPDVEPLRIALEDARAKVVPFTETEEYRNLTKQIEDAESALTVVPEVNTFELADEKKQILDDIQSLSSTLAKVELHKSITDTIEGLQSDLRETSIAITKWDGLMAKLMEREREWAEIVRTRANKYLKRCHVEMVEFSKAGEVNDICSVSIDGVDVGVTNSANKVICGVDVAQAFMHRYDINLPVIIDNVEQVTSDNIPEVDGQIITLRVSPPISDETVIAVLKSRGMTITAENIRIIREELTPRGLTIS